MVAVSTGKSGEGMKSFAQIAADAEIAPKVETTERHRRGLICSRADNIGKVGVADFESARRRFGHFLVSVQFGLHIVSLEVDEH
jgi:hypothetical protein